MVQLYLILIIDSFLLQPFRRVFGFIMRFMWTMPPIVAPAPLREPEEETLKHLHGLAVERLGTLGRTIHGQGENSAKFLGMLYAATGDEAEWQRTLALVRDDGTMHRNLCPQEDDDPICADEAAGFVLAVWRRLPDMTVEERQKLGRLWHNTTFRGFPFLLPDGRRGKKLFSTGHFWRPWWLLGSEDSLSAMTWLLLGQQITGLRRYSVAYTLFTCLQCIGNTFACPDGQFWRGKYYGMTSFNTHSKVLIFFVGYQLAKHRLGKSFFFSSLKQAYQRHGEYNADIRILAGSVLGEAYHTLALELLQSCANKGAKPCPTDKEYISLLWPPARVMRASCIWPPDCRGGDYVWERNPVKGCVYSETQRRARGLDLIFPVLIMEELQARGLDASVRQGE